VVITIFLMSRRGILLVTLVPFLLSLVLYVVTLAPGVTFEDSGELIAAAYNVGVPHPPGYPLFCMMGRLFAFLPFSSVAWRLNFMSAFFTAASTGILAWAVLVMLGRVYGAGRTAGWQASPPPYAHAAAIASGVLAGVAFEIWEQALITEVYGLSGFLLALDLLLLFRWEAAEPYRRDGYFYGLCFALALGLVVHPISVIMVPLALGYVLAKDSRYIASGKRLAGAAFFFILGISPVIYLPLASRNNPLVDWGNPESFHNFMLVVTRGLIPYEVRTLSKTLGQLGYYWVLLPRQWFPAFLAPAILGLVLLAKQCRKQFLFVAAFFLLSAPIVSLIVNINVTAGQPEVIAGNKWIVSVFYIPSYFCVSLAAGVGFYYIGAKLAQLFKSRVAGAVVVVLLPIAAVPFTYGRVDMSHYRFAEDYASDVLDLANENALVIAEYDPEFFPLIYYQAVEGRRPDVIVISRLQLSRSWYLQVLKDHHPELVAASARETAEFLRALAPFEAKQAYDGRLIQTRYEALINSFIDKTVAAGRSVYLTFVPADPVASSYQKESLGVILRLTPEGAPLDPLDLRQLRMSDYDEPGRRLDFPASFIMDHIRNFMSMRATQLQAAGRKAEANQFFQEAAKLRE